MGAVGEYVMNGSFVGATVYGTKKLRSVVRPTQRMWFVHPKVGMTARYKIRLDINRKDVKL